MAHKFLPDDRKLLDYEGKLICPVNEGSYPVSLKDIHYLCPFLPGQTTFSQCRKSLFGFFICTKKDKTNWRVRMKAKVGVIMGSKSDWETMQHACAILDELEIIYEKKVVSAHRTPELMFEYAEEARDKGIKVIIAGAGGAAHLPGMVAAKTTLPVIGVPVQSKALNGLDSLLSIVQMPGGVPVATVAIGKAGATNAGLLAAQILGTYESNIADRLAQKREQTKKEVLESSDELV
jgi:5-(carboxyamino)imidazole ribonucleotide mutase